MVGSMFGPTSFQLFRLSVFRSHLPMLFALAVGGLTLPAAENAPHEARPSDPPKVGPGTAKMAALLERLNRENDANASRNPFANEARAKSLRSQLSNT